MVIAEVGAEGDISGYSLGAWNSEFNFGAFIMLKYYDIVAGDEV